MSLPCSIIALPLGGSFYIWPSRRVHAKRVCRKNLGGKVPVVQRLKKTVALVGMMGAGKTAIGNALARRLAVPFLDSDAALEAASGMSVAEIFARDGEAFFRARETEVIARLMGGPPGILSTGGGAFMSAENRALMSAEGVSVFLRADLDLLWSRVRHKTTRPLLRTDNPKQTLADLLETRGPIYALADISVTAQASYQIDDMVEAVRAALLARSDLWEE